MFYFKQMVILLYDDIHAGAFHDSLGLLYVIKHIILSRINRNYYYCNLWLVIPQFDWTREGGNYRVYLFFCFAM